MPFRIARLPLTFVVLAFALALGSGCTKRTPALASAHPGEGGAGAEGDGATQARTQQLQEGPDIRTIPGEGASGSDISGGAFTGEGGPLARSDGSVCRCGRGFRSGGIPSSVTLAVSSTAVPAVARGAAPSVIVGG